MGMDRWDRRLGRGAREECDRLGGPLFGLSPNVLLQPLTGFKEVALVDDVGGMPPPTAPRDGRTDGVPHAADQSHRKPRYRVVLGAGPARDRRAYIRPIERRCHARR
jgi:hypothetical protein